MESYIQFTPLNNYLSNCVIKLRMKLLTPNLPLSNCVIKLHMKLLTSNLPLGNCVIKLHQVTCPSTPAFSTHPQISHVSVRPRKRSLFHFPHSVTLVYINTSPINQMRCLPSSFCYILPTSRFHRSIAPTKMNLQRLLKIEGPIMMYIVPPLQMYIGERRRAFA